jgi:hypothetical protein
MYDIKKSGNPKYAIEKLITEILAIQVEKHSKMSEEELKNIYTNLLKNNLDVGYIILNGSLTSRTLRQHLTLDLTVNCHDLINMIECPKFWFDVYVESTFRLHFIEKNQKDKDSKLENLDKIKTRLTSFHNKKLSDELQDFDRKVNNRLKTMNLTDSDNQSSIDSKYLAIDAEFAKTDKTLEKGTSSVKLLTRFNSDVHTFEAVKEMIGEAIPLSNAIKATTEQVLVNKYIKGETLNSAELAIAENILKLQFTNPDFTVQHKNLGNLKSIRESNLQSSKIVATKKQASTKAKAEAGKTTKKQAEEETKRQADINKDIKQIETILKENKGYDTLSGMFKPGVKSEFNELLTELNSKYGLPKITINMENFVDIEEIFSRDFNEEMDFQKTLKKLSILSHIYNREL